MGNYIDAHGLRAVHLSTALVARSLVIDLRLLSLDERRRLNTAEIEFDLLPAA